MRTVNVKEQKSEIKFRSGAVANSAIPCQRGVLQHAPQPPSSTLDTLTTGENITWQYVTMTTGPITTVGRHHGNVWLVTSLTAMSLTPWKPPPAPLTQFIFDSLGVEMSVNIKSAAPEAEEVLQQHQAIHEAEQQQEDVSSIAPQRDAGSEEDGATVTSSSCCPRVSQMGHLPRWRRWSPRSFCTAEMRCSSYCRHPWRNPALSSDYSHLFCILTMWLMVIAAGVVFLLFCAQMFKSTILLLN